MKRIIISLLFTFCIAMASGQTPAQQPEVWRPSPGHPQIPIWPDAAPDARPMPGPEKLDTGEMQWVCNVTRPTMTVYSPEGTNTGAAVIVVPGGGFEGLAMDIEGTDVCDWLTRQGITCVLLKYRVPSAPYEWQTDARPDNHMVPTQALEDLQRTVGLVRARRRMAGRSVEDRRHRIFRGRHLVAQARPPSRPSARGAGQDVRRGHGIKQRARRSLPGPPAGSSRAGASGQTSGRNKRRPSGYVPGPADVGQADGGPDVSFFAGGSAALAPDSNGVRSRLGDGRVQRARKRPPSRRSSQPATRGSVRPPPAPPRRGVALVRDEATADPQTCRLTQQLFTVRFSPTSKSRDHGSNPFRPAGHLPPQAWV